MVWPCKTDQAGERGALTLWESHGDAANQILKKTKSWQCRDWRCKRSFYIERPQDCWSLWSKPSESTRKRDTLQKRKSVVPPIFHSSKRRQNNNESTHCFCSRSPQTHQQSLYSLWRRAIRSKRQLRYLFTVDISPFSACLISYLRMHGNT